MNKKIAVGLSAMVLALGGISAVAFAENSTSANANVTTSFSSSMMKGDSSPMMINIGPKGNVMLRGQVVSVGTGSLVVKSWGGSWTVKTVATTKILSTNKLLTDIKADDFVGVLGTISADGNFVIDASIVRQWGQKADSDKDGIPDSQDNDDDNDGMDNMHDSHRHDRNNDGILDTEDSLKLKGDLKLNLGGRMMDGRGEDGKNEVENE